MEERETRVQQLGSEVREISQAIALLVNQSEKKKEELREISDEIKEREKELEGKENELRILQSSALQNLESNAGKYVKVHYLVKADSNDEDCAQGIEIYWVGLLGKLKHNAAKKLVAPIDNCISISKDIITHKTSVFNIGSEEITPDMIDSPSFSFEFITKEEANEFILSYTPKL